MFFIWPELVKPGDKDAIFVEYLNGERLRFETVEKCHKHVDDNLEKLKGFAKANFKEIPGALVAQILCVEKDEGSA